MRHIGARFYASPVPRLSGGLHPDEVRERCGLELPDGDFETLAGFVLQQLGRIPAPGDAFDADGWRVEVLTMRRHRIVSVLVTPLEPGS